MKRIVLCLSLLCLTSPVWADTAVIAPMIDAGVSDGSGSGVTTTTTVTVETKPSDSVVDPIEHPATAIDQAKIAKKSGWAMLVFFVLVALTKGLAYGRDKFAGLPGIGWIARRLSVGKTAMIVAGIGAVGAAGYDVLVGGGSVTAALFAAGAAIAGVLHSTTKGAAGEQAAST